MSTVIGAQENDEWNRFGAHLSYSPMSMLMPYGFGGAINLAPNKKWQIEGEYLNASAGLSIPIVDIKIASISERHISVQARRYFGKSFNLLMGMGQRDIKIKFAADLYDLVADNRSFTSDHLQSRYARLGLGNRFTFKQHWDVRVDWLVVNIPWQAKVKKSSAKYARDLGIEEEIELAQNIIAWAPSMAVSQFSFGYSF